MIALDISTASRRSESAGAGCAGLDLILDQLGAEMAHLPCGASGMLVRDYKGKEADRLVVRIDPGVVSLVAEMRGNDGRPPRNWASGGPTTRSAR